MMSRTGESGLRNLLGRLNARSSEDLGEIAEIWRSPVSSRDRLTQIANLYRTMTKPTMVRVQVDALPAEIRRVLDAVLAHGESGATVGELALELGITGPETREHLGQLYRAGMLAYEGNASTLPVGDTPIVFVPIELANVIAEVDAERIRGDISDQSFETLIAARTDGELNEAADLLHIDRVAGITGRPTIERELVERLASPAARHQIVEGLSHETRVVWDRLQKVPAGTPLSVASVISQGNDRTHFGRLGALNDLETRLLIWPTIVDDARAIFIPRHEASATDATMPKPISDTTLPAFPWRPECPLAWDLTVVLQRLIGPAAPAGIDLLDPPANLVDHLRPMLWNTNEREIPIGYIGALIDLAISVGLVDEPDEGNPAFGRTPAVREWRLGPWSMQANRLRSAWMNAATWIEGDNERSIEPWQIDWQGYRVKLLHHLSSFEPERLYRLSDIAQWIAAFDPALLGQRASVAVLLGAPRHDTSRSTLGAELLIEHSIRTMITWLGLVDTIIIATGEEIIRIRPILRDVMRATGEPEVQTGQHVEMSVTPDLRIVMRNPSAIQIWSVMAFADPVQLGQISTFALTAESIATAQLSGFRPDQIVQFLLRQAGTHVPPDLAELVASQAAIRSGIELSASVTIQCATDDKAEALQGIVESAGYDAQRSGPNLEIAIGLRRDVSSDIARLLQVLELAGEAPIRNRIRT